MQALPQGKIAVTTAGTPVQLPALSGGACRIRIANIIGETGHIYVGKAALVKATFVNVIADLWPTGAGGAKADVLEMESEEGADTLHPEDYWLDAGVSGEGALVTYWVR